MKAVSKLAAAAFLLSGLAFAAGGRTAPPQAGGAAGFEEAARYLSGLPCQSAAWRKHQDAPEWKAFAASLDSRWADLESARLRPMRDWAASELAACRAGTRILFYPFGGPDFLTAFELFPEAETFVLFGLEPVGRLPDFETAPPERAAAFLRTLDAVVDDFFKRSFFITDNMEETLSDEKINGVLPLLAFFLKRTGHILLSVRRTDILPNGELMDSDLLTPRLRTKRPYGVRIEFRPAAGGPPRTLLYFSADLWNGQFRAGTPLDMYLAALPFETTFVKSGTYLLHYDTFTRLRRLILNKTRFVFEDDTGVPYRFFPPEAWDSRLYGEYAKPLVIFENVWQKDLRAAYAEPGRVRPLPFHFGYHWRTNQEALLLFSRKPGRSAGRP